jgi:Tyrosyl-DNA phosphodiesterase
MNNAEWKNLLGPFSWKAARDAGEHAPDRLKRALLTSFDAIDAQLLVEHLLPHWFRISREIGDDDTSRNPFLVELSEHLKTVESLVVVSSAVFPEGHCPYPWLWRFLRPVMVGAETKAVQHSKLWLLEWDEPATLEVCISSANLTISAFRDQIQAAWRCAIPLVTASQRRRQSWGILPEFVEELANACSPSSRDTIRSFTKLFDHATCPEGVQFLASVPGTHSLETLRQRPWGAAGLRKAMPRTPGGRPKAYATVPVIGSWSQNELFSWLEACGCGAEQLTVGWISNDVIQYRGHWTLPSTTKDLFLKQGVSVVALQRHTDAQTPITHDKHHPGDQRWLHAKLYGFSSGKRHSLLLTSANFTPAAWGRQTPTGLRIENFELGVLLEGARYPFHLEPLDPGSILVQDVPSPVQDDAIVWAEALWDGNAIVIAYRPAIDETVVSAVTVHAIADGRGCQANYQVSSTDEGSLRIVRLPWEKIDSIPVEAELIVTDRAACLVPILDVRAIEERLLSPMPQLGLDHRTEEHLREQLLLERYRGTVVAGEDNEVPPDTDHCSARPLDDYSVPMFAQAREWFAVADDWHGRLIAANCGGGSMRTVLVDDGKSLLRYFERQSREHVHEGHKVAASLVAQELASHIQHADHSQEKGS